MYFLFHLLITLLIWTPPGSVRAGPATSTPPPAVLLVTDGPPINAAFFSPPGPSLERFTGTPGAWYSVFRLPMLPSYPYSMRFFHENEVGVIKLYALDDHPFGKIGLKQELPLSRFVSNYKGRSVSIYEASFFISADRQANGIYLLFEWILPVNQSKPVPLTLEVIEGRVGYAPGRWSNYGAHRGIPSPLQSQLRPFEIPINRGINESLWFR